MEKKKVFVIMPFKEIFFDVYDMLKNEFIEDFEFSNANEVGNPQNIMKDVIQPIYEADIVLADLTGLNPNVMYELGLAHSFNKKTIVITQDDINDLPFDLKQYRAKDYSIHFKRFAELIEYLKRILKGAVDNTVSFSNPVKDFLSTEHIDACNWFKEEDNISLEEIGEAGFLDYLADIETDTAELARSIQAIGSDMRDMNNGFEHSIGEIERVHKTGGSGTANFVRKEAKRVSTIMDSFSTNLRKNNKDLFALWDKIEKNFLGLIDSPYATTKDNIIEITKYILSLKSLRCSAAESKRGIAQFQGSTKNVLGIERTLNQSARNLKSDLGTYIDFFDYLDKSIEKIINRSRLIISDFEEEKTTCD